jgi:glycosyltransferase involved in cell wall biosynthesis
LASSLTRFRGELLAALSAHGHEIIACAPDPDPATQRELALRGIEVRPIRLARNSISPIADLRYTRDLQRLIHDVEPQVVFAYTPKPVIYSGLACRNQPHVRHFALISGLGYGFGTDTLGQRLLTPIMASLYRAALARSHTVIFQNADDAQVFIERRLVTPEHALVVPGSGVNTEEFSAAPLPEAPTFLLMARLIPEKGVREYVAAARIVRAHVPAARFLLAGWLEQRLGAIAPAELEQWQREGVIEYLGVLDDVRPAITQARVYVLPSYYREGVPRSVLEAMSMGRPILTTDMPGCRDTVPAGENGVLVRPRDTQHLAEAMLRLASDHDLVRRMGAASRELAQQRFSAERVNTVMLAAMEL